MSQKDAQHLHDLLSGELHRSRALVEIFSAKKAPAAGSKPLMAQLSSYPQGGVDLENIVTYPPQLEPVPVKPLFLDVAWNYINYPDKTAAGAKDKGKAQAKPGAAASEQEAKPQKRGWFGFGR